MMDKISPGLIKRKIKIFNVILYFLIFLFLSSFFLFQAPQKVFCEPNSTEPNSTLNKEEINISAESAVIVNYDTGEILWEKNSSKKMYPASLTKMLSSIIVIENINDLEEIIRIPASASGRNHSAFKLKTGDRVSILDLLKASLIISHNNAIVALSEYVSGSSEDFTKLMNAKAREIGAYDTLFQNVNGLDSEFPDHKSTAADLAKIASYCMKNDLFRKIVSTKNDTIKISNKEIEITNTNNLLEYEYISGIKTGLTNNAGYCIALYSEKDDLRLITVILNNKTIEERNEDSLRLLGWAYDNLKYTKIADQEKPVVSVSAGSQTIMNIDLYPETDYIDVININSDTVDFKNRIKDDINLPVKKNEVMGYMDIYVNGKKVKEIPLVSHDYIGAGYIYQELTDTGTGTEQTSFIIISVALFYFLIFLIIIVRNLFLRRNI
ncbi:MAG: D-alanyl-D-alanine carboxypeptidase [Actinomycetota bacterium]|nr:D-alanyl-D-alanine carboxypeptidase [Actinomycetota bacterium]